MVGNGVIVIVNGLLMIFSNWWKMISLIDYFSSVQKEANYVLPRLGFVGYYPQSSAAAGLDEGLR